MAKLATDEACEISRATKSALATRAARLIELREFVVDVKIMDLNQSQM
jgi:hypothetical protein